MVPKRDHVLGLGSRRFRLLLVISAFLLSSLCLPSRAIASTYMGDTTGVAEDFNDFTCDWFGYDYDTMPAGLKSVLFNSTPGGSGTISLPNFSDYASFRESLYFGIFGVYSTYSGAGFIDASDKARADLEAAMRWWDKYGDEVGDNPGGGGDTPVGPGGGEVGDGIPSDIVLNGVNGYYQTGDYANLPHVENTTRNVHFSSVTSLNTFLSNNELTYYALVLIANWGSNYSASFYLYASASPISVTYEETTERPNHNYDYKYLKVTVESNSNLYYSSNSIWNVNQQNLTCSLSSLSSMNRTTTYQTGVLGYWCTSAPSHGGGNDEPEPEPERPIPDPEPPIEPTPDQPTYESAVDLTEVIDILKTINANLVTFSESFGEYWDWWHDVLTSIVTDLDAWQEDVTGWLRLIYNKLTGQSTTKPDPGDNLPDALDWLADIIDAINALLLGISPLQLAELMAALSDLMRVFPFSIPWDIAALLGLLSSDPVTPVFDIPYPYSATGTVLLHIDCSPWNSLMYMVRRFEFIGFAIYLAVHTKDLIRNVEVD